jgi:hypothetical protein
MYDLEQQHRNVFLMMGLHPTYVKELSGRAKHRGGIS